jgi:predicted nucleic acid-binding protein
VRVVFADTFSFLALANSREAKHQKAVAFSHSNSIRLVTTVWVLLEVGDAMAKAYRRYLFETLYRSLIDNPSCRIIPADQSTFERGLELFFGRADKDWSLTDCLSFMVMEDEGIQEALTSDHHFTQAGFVTLFEEL